MLLLSFKMCFAMAHSWCCYDAAGVIGLGFLSCCCFCCWWHYFSSVFLLVVVLVLTLILTRARSWYCYGSASSSSSSLSLAASVSASQKHVWNCITRLLYSHTSLLPWHQTIGLQKSRNQKWYLPFSSTQCLNIKSIQIKRKFYLNHQRSATSPHFQRLLFPKQLAISWSAHPA